MRILLDECVPELALVGTNPERHVLRAALDAFYIQGRWLLSA